MSDVACVSTSVTANGLDFTGMQWGPSDGPLVLCLHGFPQRCTSWTAVAERLATAGLRVVAIDQRGYSPGARPRDVADYALPHLLADAVGMIEALRRSERDPVHLVGHDWGGVVGWQVAARHPELVRTWTAVSTPNTTALAEVLPHDDAQRARFGYIRHFRQAGTAEASLLAGGGARLAALYGTAVQRQRVAEDVAFFSQPGVLTAALSWYRAMSPTDAADVPPVTVPTTYVWGSEDPAFGPEAARDTQLHVQAPYRFMPLDGAGHWLPDEAADTLADAIAARVEDR
jgi:pimeloyl-ACP methyl ester carboxylesterase